MPRDPLAASYNRPNKLIYFAWTVSGRVNIPRPKPSDITPANTAKQDFDVLRTILNICFYFLFSVFSFLKCCL